MLAKGKYFERNKCNAISERNSTAEKHSTAIYEQNLSKLTCFTEAAEVIAMLSRFSRLLFVVSLGRLIQT